MVHYTIDNIFLFLFPWVIFCLRISLAWVTIRPFENTLFDSIKIILIYLYLFGLFYTMLSLSYHIFHVTGCLLFIPVEVLGIVFSAACCMFLSASYKLPILILGAMLWLLLLFLFSFSVLKCDSVHFPILLITQGKPCFSNNTLFW